MVAIVRGVAFALAQAREYRRSRHREAAMELLHSFQTPEFVRAIIILFRLDIGLSKKEVEQRLGDDIASVFGMMMTLESVGILVYRGEIDIEMVDDLFSGAIVLSWQRLRRYVEELREEQNRNTLAEWWQWLAERMAERESLHPPEPAHIAHKGWAPPS